MTIDNREMNRRLIRLSENPTSRFWRFGYEDLSNPERVFLVIWELESEVNNGGFHQYFYNRSGALAPNVVGALNTIGAQATAGIVQRALNAVVNTITSWSEDASRQAKVNQLSSETRQLLEELDQEYYACPEDLTPLLYNYVAGHRTEIRAPADF
jgi:Domain of unknown function (DUF4375)